MLEVDPLLDPEVGTAVEYPVQVRDLQKLALTVAADEAVSLLAFEQRSTCTRSCIQQVVNDLGTQLDTVAAVYDEVPAHAISITDEHIDDDAWNAFLDAKASQVNPAWAH